MVCSCYLDTKKLILRLKAINEMYGIKLLDDYYYAPNYLEGDRHDY